jgi:Rad3-related DNA helicase
MRDVKFIQLPSVFPADRRPIYYQPSARLSHKEFATSGPKVVADLVKLLQGMPEKKILVHTVSYRLAELVLSSPLRYRAISYTQPGQRVEALEGFKSAPPGAILVACSMGRGVDLPYDSCDVVVILKIAYPNLADPQVARRLHSGSGGQNWYIVQTIREIVQASGRAMRFEDDRCEVYILDAMFEELYERYRKVFPPWWREALRLPAKSRVVRPSEPPR